MRSKGTKIGNGRHKALPQNLPASCAAAIAAAFAVPRVGSPAWIRGCYRDGAHEIDGETTSLARRDVHGEAEAEYRDIHGIVCAAIHVIAERSTRVLLKRGFHGIL